jgi:hypothetical protein
MIRIDDQTFEPAVFSNQELAFLLDHLTETPTAALHKGTPVGVNPIAVQTLLIELQRYDQLQKVHGVQWAGFEAVEESILRYLAWTQRSDEIYRRTGGPTSPRSIKYPSQFAWDSQGSAFKGGIDADSAEMVRTEILDDGSRKPFGVKLLEPAGRLIPALEEVAPWVKTGAARPKLNDKIEEIVTGRNGVLRCSICGQSENFDTKSRQTRVMARTRMARHLKVAKQEVSRHRLLHRMTFESPTRKA